VGENLLGEGKVMNNPIEGDHKACCEALYAALENIAGDLYLLGMAEIKLEDVYEGSQRDALKLLKRLQQYRADGLKHQAIPAHRRASK
jgi:hypothetical protein